MPLARIRLSLKHKKIRDLKMYKTVKSPYNIVR
jgi:hypothetical protein